VQSKLKMAISNGLGKDILPHYPHKFGSISYICVRLVLARRHSL